MKTKIHILSFLILASGASFSLHASTGDCPGGAQLNFCTGEGDFTHFISTQRNNRTITTFNASAAAPGGKYLGRLRYECRNGEYQILSEQCEFRAVEGKVILSTNDRIGDGHSSTGGTSTGSHGTVTSATGYPVTSQSMSSADPCSTPQAQNIFNARLGAAQKQSAATNRELNKTVSNPVIAEGAIKNARSCNDMVRDALNSVFEGTPMGNLMSLFGLDQKACDALYDFQNEVESEFDTTAIEDAIALAEEASSISGSDPTLGSAIGGIVGGAVNILPGGSSSPSTTETAPTSTPQLVGQWRETGRYTPCTYENGQSIEYKIYQCVDDTNAVILTSYCQGNPPRTSRTCSSISNSGGGVNNAIY